MMQLNISNITTSHEKIDLRAHKRYARQSIIRCAIETGDISVKDREIFAAHCNAVFKKKIAAWHNPPEREAAAVVWVEYMKRVLVRLTFTKPASKPSLIVDNAFPSGFLVSETLQWALEAKALFDEGAKRELIKDQANRVAKHIAQLAHHDAKKMLNYEARLDAMNVALEAARESLLRDYVQKIEREKYFMGCDDGTVIDPVAVKIGLAAAKLAYPSIGNSFFHAVPACYITEEMLDSGLTEAKGA